MDCKHSVFILTALVLWMLCSSCATRYEKGLTYIEPRVSLSGDWPLAKYHFFFHAASQDIVYRCRIEETRYFRHKRYNGLLRLSYDRDKQCAGASFVTDESECLFDLGFYWLDSFSVQQIAPSFDHHSRVRELRQDFDLLYALTQNTQNKYKKEDTIFCSAKSYGDLAYFVDDTGSDKLKRIDVLHKGRLKARIQPMPNMTGKVLPDSLVIRNYRGHFKLSAKMIQGERGAED